MSNKIDSGFGERPDSGGKFSRRHLLRSSFLAGGALFAGYEKLALLPILQSSAGETSSRGKLVGTIPFTDEAQVPMEAPLGAELDGRLYTDLSKLTPENNVISPRNFYIRTRASSLLKNHGGWSVKISGLVVSPLALANTDLTKMAKPMGRHLLECAGNARAVHFGMMSVAEWAGVPVSELIRESKPQARASRVLISGFDSYATKSTSSIPGASWIFRRDELGSANAFFATEMNGSPLADDHGAPIRLVVPGWYGCAYIKWVNEIRLTDDQAEATSQMQEYAARTMQTGVPRLARDYKPARIEQAAMPIRVEKWVSNEKIAYRIVGIAWGGTVPLRNLQIRFNPEEDYVPVDGFVQKSNDPWSFWTHWWRPKLTGSYLIRLRVADPSIPARRMEAGYYMRSVEIDDI
jgi:DMSO/TMAO reductase YedYZ molybdopterin-dependent catalytic subunit